MESAVRGRKWITNEVDEAKSHTSDIDRCDNIHRWNASPRLGPDNVVE